MSLDFDSARLPNPNITETHEAWRTQLRRFIDTEIMPYAEEWDEAGEIPIELWPKAAAVGPSRERNVTYTSPRNPISSNTGAHNTIPTTPRTVVCQGSLTSAGTS